MGSSMLRLYKATRPTDHNYFVFTFLRNKGPTITYRDGIAIL